MRGLLKQVLPLLLLSNHHTLTASDNRIPKNFQSLPDLIAEGPSGKINYHVVEAIKDRLAYSECTAFGITGKVWWSKIDNRWCIEIFKSGAYLTSLSGEAIEDLMNNLRKYALARTYLYR